MAPRVVSRLQPDEHADEQVRASKEWIPMAHSAATHEWEAVLGSLDDERRREILWRYGQGNQDVAATMSFRHSRIPFDCLSPVAQQRWVGEAKRMLVSTSRRQGRWPSVAPISRPTRRNRPATPDLELLAAI